MNKFVDEINLEQNLKNFYNGLVKPYMNYDNLENIPVLVKESEHNYNQPIRTEEGRFVFAEFSCPDVPVSEDDFIRIIEQLDLEWMMSANSIKFVEDDGTEVYQTLNAAEYSSTSIAYETQLGSLVVFYENNNISINFFTSSTSPQNLTIFSKETWVNPKYEQFFNSFGKIQSVSVNDEPVEIDAEKNVNIEVPETTSDLTNDSDFVSDGNYIHTDNNYTNEEKEKLNNINSSATQIQLILSGTELTIKEL